MVNISFEELIQAVHQLKPEQKRALIQTIQPDIAEDDAELTREQALAEFEALRLAGAFDHVESLYGKYAREGVSVTNEELDAYLHQIGNAWEQDIDDLLNAD